MKEARRRDRVTHQPVGDEPDEYIQTSTKVLCASTCLDAMNTHGLGAAWRRVVGWLTSLSRKLGRSLSLLALLSLLYLFSLLSLLAAFSVRYCRSALCGGNPEGGSREPGLGSGGTLVGHQ